MSRPFHLVDVFGTDAFSGNPVAVISAAEGLSTDDMQSITRWMNLSETTFLLAPTHPAADYRVRIFTLAHELAFAGHPTLGTAHVWLEAGGRPKSGTALVQECGAGLIQLHHAADQLAFAAPPLIKDSALSEAEIHDVAKILRIDRKEIQDAVWADNGPGWVAVMLESAEAVLALNPMRFHEHRVDIGVVGPCAKTCETSFEIRAFFSDAYGGIMEDPVTGSLNASVGQWLFRSGRVASAYVASQGTKLGRSGRIYIHQDAAGQVWVGGKTKTLFSGQGV